MKEIFRKSFGGLTREYYFRQVIFSLPIATVLIYAVYSTQESSSALIERIITCIFLSALYPYARYVYESIAKLILGDNLILLPLYLVLPFKLISILVCYMFSFGIAPFGLIYLHYANSRDERLTQKADSESAVE